MAVGAVVSFLCAGNTMNMSFTYEMLHAFMAFMAAKEQLQPLVYMAFVAGAAATFLAFMALMAGTAATFLAFIAFMDVGGPLRPSWFSWPALPQLPS
jgi:hypothetical protein